MRETDRAYAAGLIDGEGCIRVHHDPRNDTFNPTVMIEMAEVESINWFSAMFAGRKVQAPRKRKDHYRQTYRWEVRGEAALEFLTEILPYLRGKREQAETLLSWPSRGMPWGRGQLMPDDVRESRRGIYQHLQEIKRGFQESPRLS